MRRRGIVVLALAVIAAVLVGTWMIAFRLGESGGRDKVSADRRAFLTSIPSNAQGAAAGGASGAAGTRGAGGGSAVAGAGAPGRGGGNPGGAAGGAPSGGAAGSPAATSSLTGHVTKIDGATITVQQSDNSTVAVTTTRDTTIQKRVAGTPQPGTLADIKTGDLLVVQGDKTGSTGFLARSIINQGAG